MLRGWSGIVRGGAELSCCDPIYQGSFNSSQIAGLPEKPLPLP